MKLLVLIFATIVAVSAQKRYPQRPSYPRITVPSFQPYFAPFPPFFPFFPFYPPIPYPSLPSSGSSEEYAVSLEDAPVGLYSKSSGGEGSFDGGLDVTGASLGGTKVGLYGKQNVNPSGYAAPLARVPFAQGVRQG
ncbi:uncharacterized protein LOC118191222 [Stegodyphus dumicola]|uniref:uncharacterized protein LOC118191222 n=1 Tax=Stegodyphus dumicola TaxID=202533 RepID=UPI0015B2F7A9|nr:uncharacterized protein LOC118191222 [Stegodyphus dumicola]